MVWAALTDNQKGIFNKFKEKSEREEAKRKEALKRAGEHRQHFQSLLVEQQYPRTVDDSRFQQFRVQPPTVEAFRKVQAGGPLNYNERSHRYTVTFRNSGGETLKQLYRGDKEFCKRLIEQQLEEYPPGTKAEITITTTNEIVYQCTKI
jgi:anion-transporting  ArsA/GET3 family ATPase